MLKKIAGSLVLILVVVGVLAGIGYTKYKQMTTLQPPPPEHPEQVIFEHPQLEPIQQSTTTVGTVLAPRSISLRTEVSGTVSEMSFKAGQVVSPKQLLLKLDTSVEEAQLAGAKAAMKIAESTLKRTKQAADMRALSELELDQAEAIMVQAKSDVMRLEATILKKTLRAPFEARAGLFEIQVGQYLTEGTQITMLQGLDEYVYIDFMMPQHVADELHVGDKIRLPAEPGICTPEIIAIDSQADRLTRNVMARAELKHPPKSMQPNDSVRIQLEYGTPVQACTISAAALRRSPDGPFVYLVEPSRKDNSKLIVRKQPVEPLQTIGQRVALRKGLSLDQTIVAVGSFKLQEETWVVDIKTLSDEKPSGVEVAAP